MGEVLGTHHMYVDDGDICRKADFHLDFCITRSRDELIDHFKCMGWIARRAAPKKPRKIREELSVQLGPSQMETLRKVDQEYVNRCSQRPLTKEEKLHWNRVKISINRLIAGEAIERTKTS